MRTRAVPLTILVALLAVLTLFSTGDRVLGGSDADADGVPDATDNCPNWPNPMQTLPPWSVPANDGDCDSIDTPTEQAIGTVATSACAATSTANDEALPDRWAMDFDDNRVANTIDVGRYIPFLNSQEGDGVYQARYDIRHDDTINTLDIGKFVPVLNKTCTPAEAPCAGPAFPALPPDPGGSAVPQADSYGLQTLLSSTYLGDANGADIEFAMIPGRPNEAIVARQSGHIYRVAMDQSFAPQLWGNVSGLVNFGGEEGLLSVQFSPTFTSDCRVYAYYTPGCGNPCEPTVLSRFAATPADLNEASEQVLLQVEEFAGNHNGGHIAFDNQGYLYLSLGDGGGSNDPTEAGQRLNTLLGKVLRLNVSGATGYTIPPGNPFADGAGPNKDEIFAYGFRNPFRMTIDPVSNEIWLGDVGQGSWEEVDKVTIGGNYGWDCREGAHDFETTGCPPLNQMIDPRAEYSHSFGQAVTGGVVYRGDEMPELYGWYVYGDFYSGRIWAVDTQGTGPAVQLVDTNVNIASFTLLPDGEIAVVTYDGGIRKLINP